MRVWTIPGARRIPDPGDDFLVTAPAVLMLQHTAPSMLNLFSRNSFLIGLIVGWLLTARAVRRGRGHRGHRQTAVLLTTVGAVLLTVAVDAFVLELNLSDVIAGTRSAALMPTVLTSPLLILALPTGLVLLVAFLVAIWPRSLTPATGVVITATPA